MNKFFVITIFAITFCQCQQIDPFAGLTRLKNTVKSVSNDLECYGNNFIFNTKIQLNDLKFNQMQKINAAVGKALQDTQNDIAAAEKEGKNAQHCAEPNRIQLRDASVTAYTRLDICVDVELALLVPAKNNIDPPHITKGKLLFSELDGIAMNCASGDQRQARNCVTQKMPAASASVNNYEATAEQLKSIGVSLSNSAPTSVTRCFQLPISDFHSATSLARRTANECIRFSLFK